MIYDIETTGLYPMNPEELEPPADIKKRMESWEAARITSIGCTIDGKDIRVFCDEDEKKLLTEFWEFVEASKVSRFVGYNNNHFDDHFLFWRTILHDIPHGFPFVSYGTSLDLRPFLLYQQSKLFGSQAYRKGRLTQMAKALGIDTSDISIDLNGEKMREAYLRGDWESIKKHQRDDILLTWRVYRKVRYFIPMNRTIQTIG